MTVRPTLATDVAAKGAALRALANPLNLWRVALLAFGLAGFALIAWLTATAWRPDRAEWPIQGVAVGPANRPLNWETLAQLGADFAYIDISRGPRMINPAFARDQAAAMAAGVRAGAIHHFSICELASEQAEGFVRYVPRLDDALPPLVLIDDEGCETRPSRALLLSELATFLAQIETHTGKLAIIGPSAAVEEDYALTSAINRSLFVARDWRVPAPERGNWALWQANSRLRIDGAEGSVRWLVLRRGAPPQQDIRP